MVAQVQTGIEVTRTRKSGAITSGIAFIHDLEGEDAFRLISPADAAVVTSPKKDDGTHANLTVRKNGSGDNTVRVIKGGQSVTIFGPIRRLEIVPDATVAGTGTDDVEIVYSGTKRIR